MICASSNTYTTPHSTRQRVNALGARTRHCHHHHTIVASPRLPRSPCVQLQSEAKLTARALCMDAADTDVASIAAWVARRGCARVALQFPDALLDAAVATTRQLQALCPVASFYVLADTTFGRRVPQAAKGSPKHSLPPAPSSCCVDEVAASHVDAQCVVHFGRSCLSRVSRLPTLLVFPRLPIDVSH